MNAQLKRITRQKLTAIPGGENVIKTKITNSELAAEVFRCIWDTSTIKKLESFYAIFLNRRCELVSHKLINKGKRSTCEINLRYVVECAFDDDEIEYIAVAHNHPSGSLTPSEEDIVLTNSIGRVFEALDFKLVDHIILTEDDYYSFKDSNRI